MSKYSISDRVKALPEGDLIPGAFCQTKPVVAGTVCAVERTRFGHIMYTIAAPIPNSFDSKGRALEKYKYFRVTEDLIIDLYKPPETGWPKIGEAKYTQCGMCGYSFGSSKEYQYCGVTSCTEHLNEINGKWDD